MRHQLTIASEEKPPAEMCIGFECILSGENGNSIEGTIIGIEQKDNLWYVTFEYFRAEKERILN